MLERNRVRIQIFLSMLVYSYGFTLFVLYCYSVTFIWLDFTCAIVF
jgi:hypothetical protein